MELKGRRSKKSTCRYVFQSHLYGIERPQRMHNQCWRVCFNRTFMELKDVFLTSFFLVRRFQSHLYGIESSIVWSKLFDTISFNRTFMELKVRAPQAPPQGMAGFNRTFMELKGRTAPRCLGVQRFQSHLYGIESRVVLPFLPIAQRFNRTFMELKDCRSTSRTRGLAVSIAPLWN